MSGQVISLKEEPRGPSILIEVPVGTNGQQRVAFPDISQLRSTADTKIVIKGLRLITDQVLTNAVLVSGVTAPISELQKMTITIYSEGWEKGQTIPILTLNDMESPGSTISHKYGPTYFDNWVNVDWPKSYIQYANGTSSVGTPYVVLLDCLYLRLYNNQVLQGPSK